DCHEHKKCDCCIKVNINIDCFCKTDKKNRKHSDGHKCDCCEDHECDCCEDHECDCCEDHECDCYEDHECDCCEDHECDCCEEHECDSCEHRKCDCCTDVIAKILRAIQTGQSSSHCDKQIIINININNK
ncbi:hypothetical protein ACFVR2_18635, partial [Gottfriedia sp. NPDC057991]|uniref:hypothetical protein n=1 Tax=Gottfriedia sp. NPDC057991 TaxID=3346298 RepID=UPI0036DF7772